MAGFTIVQDTYPIVGRPANLSAMSTHALLLGNDGERMGRLAIDGDGALRWGNGGAGDEFDTTLLKPTHKKLFWDPPPLAAGKATLLTVPMGAKPHCRGLNHFRKTCDAVQKHLLFYGQPEPGDLVQVGFSGAGAAAVQLTAQVSASFPDDPVKLSEVQVVLRNVGESAVDLKNGTLRLVVTKWE
jgi:hypothetical protein